MTTDDNTDEATADEVVTIVPAGPYIGQIVYVERRNPSAENSNYYDGSYLVVQETSAELTGISMRKLGVYEFGSDHQSLPLVGRAAYTVLAADDPTQVTLDDIDQILSDVVNVLAGNATAQWVMSVYEKAFSSAVRTRKIVCRKLGLPDEPAATVAVTVQEPLPLLVAPAQVPDQEVRELLSPVASLLRPLSLAGASAELHIVFPPASEKDRQAEDQRRSSAQRIADQIAEARR